VPEDGPQGPKQVALIDFIIKDLLCLTVIYIPVLRWTGSLNAYVMVLLSILPAPYSPNRHR